MNLQDLQHQIAQSAEATSALFIYLPVIVMMIPLLLVYVPLRSLRTPFSWLTRTYHGLMNSAHKHSP